MACVSSEEQIATGFPRPNRGVRIMRPFLLPAALAVGLAFVPSTAQASKLSQFLHRLRGDDCAPNYDYAPPVNYGYAPPPHYDCAPDYGYAPPADYSYAPPSTY